MVLVLVIDLVALVVVGVLVVSGVAFAIGVEGGVIEVVLTSIVLLLLILFVRLAAIVWLFALSPQFRDVFNLEQILVSAVAVSLQMFLDLFLQFKKLAASVAEP